MGANSSTAENDSDPEETRRILMFQHGVHVAARENEPQFRELNQEFQRFTIKNPPPPPAEIPLNVHVRSCRVTSSSYSRVIPNSLTFLKMSERNGVQNLFNYNSFVAAPRTGFLVNGYAFLSSPILPMESAFIFVIQVPEDTSVFQNRKLAIGFTSRDPKSISWADLPYKTIEDLDDRNEYWVWNDQFATDLKIDDELGITVNEVGQVLVSKNGTSLSDLFCVDRSIPIWPFLALCGSLSEIRILGKIPVRQTPIVNTPANFPSAPPKNPNLHSSRQISLPLPPQSSLVNSQNPSQNPGPSRISPSARVNLDILLPPPPRSSPPTNRQTHNNFNHHDNHRGRGGRGRRGQGRGFRGNRGQRGANNGVTTNEHPNETRFHRNQNNSNDQQQPREHRGRWQNRGQNRGQHGRGGGQRSGDDQNPNPNQNQNQRRGGRSGGRGQSQSASSPSAEQSKSEKYKTDQKKNDDASTLLCIICCESEKNCIFVPCYHNCMCFACGNEYFQRKKNEVRGGRNPECPICRAQSTNVVRIYTA